MAQQLGALALLLLQRIWGGFQAPSLVAHKHLCLHRHQAHMCCTHIMCKHHSTSKTLIHIKINEYH